MTLDPAPKPDSDPHAHLHEMNPTGRFSDRVGDYVKFRPGYPAAAIDAILEGLADPATLRAADIGAGTGISARALADRGAHVLAIEPNADMRRGAQPHPRVRWVEGTAEATGLPDRALDLVLCAQAFHWFRTLEALAEFRRILRPAGRLALMWNKRDRADALTSRYTEAIRAVSGEHPAQTMPFDPTTVHAGGHFRPARVVNFPNRQRLTREGLIGRAMSASYVPKSGPAHEQLIRSLTDAHAAHADAEGAVELKYNTRIYLSEPVP